jgi:hypothetical protein
MQKAWSLFDGVTLGKISNSALISLGGFMCLATPYISKELIDFIVSFDPIDWRTLLVMFIGAASTWVVASVRAYVLGEPTVKEPISDV